MDKACLMYSNFLNWRKEHGVDAIREIIWSQGIRPKSFPFADSFMIKTGPQVIISPHMRDVNGNPLAVETFNYSPRAIFHGHTVEDYTQYMVPISHFLCQSLTFSSDILHGIQDYGDGTNV